MNYSSLFLTDGASCTVDAGPDVDEASIIEQKLINEEYKVWKKHAPYLYDLMLRLVLRSVVKTMINIFSRALDWPTLTTQWFPDKQR